MKYYNIQALRAFAAYCVVFHHVINSINDYIAHLDVDVFFFHAGVDMFFVTSGFIMCAATAGKAISPFKFFGARLARIAPLYWLLTFVGALALFMGLQVFGWSQFSLTQLLASLAFIPTFDPQGVLVKPVLFVGWTLNFEMLFYLLFAISLFLKSERAQKALLYGSIGAIVLAGVVSDNPIFDFYGLPCILEFAVGVALWQITQRWVLPVRAAWIALGLAVFALVASEALTLPHAYKYQLSYLIYGLPASLIVLSFISLERGGVVFKNPILQVQGDASYSLYLTHIFVFQIIGKAAIVTGFNATLWGVVATMAASVAVSAVVATFVHLRLETPMNTLARKWLVGRRAATARTPILDAPNVQPEKA